MKVKVIRIKSGRNYIQETNELTKMTEKEFFQLLDRNKDILKFEILKNK